MSENDPETEIHYTVGLPWDIKGVPSDHSLIGGGGVNTHFLGEHVSFFLIDPGVTVFLHLSD